MDLKQVALADVAGACRDETDKFLRGEPCSDACCFELVRRAVCERDHAAWEAVFSQYQGMVLSWVRRHPLSRAVQEDDVYWVTRAFERFWIAVGPDRFGLFPDLPALLRYLKMCVNSVLLDEMRAREAAVVEPLAMPEDAPWAEAPSAEALVLAGLSCSELWQAVCGALPDEKERLLAYLSFVQGWKPQEIQARHPERFATVGDVYRIKRNVVERLRRHPSIARFLGDAPQSAPATALIR